MGGRTGLAGGRNVDAFEGAGTGGWTKSCSSERSGAVTASSTDALGTFWKRGDGAGGDEENDGPAFRRSLSSSTAGSLTGLGRSSVVDSMGTVVISPHLGHFTRRPACFASTLNRPPHCEQRQICSMDAIISFQGGDARDSAEFLPLTSGAARHRTKPMTSAPLISVSGLSKTYVEGWFRRRRLEVLKGLTLEVGQGEIFGLLGPNGAGKTTFIKILLGIVRKTAGSATLIGHPAGSRRSRRLVGYLPENLRIARHHTAVTALNYYGQLNGLSVSQIARRRDELLQTVGLADRAQDSVAKYSKGMLQRLGLAQTLLHDPQLVILDEPTDGLDPVGRSHVRNVLQKLKQEGRTVFVNSHILQEVELVLRSRGHPGSRRPAVRGARAGHHDDRQLDGRDRTRPGSRRPGNHDPGGVGPAAHRPLGTRRWRDDSLVSRDGPRQRSVRHRPGGRRVARRRSQRGRIGAAKSESRAGVPRADRGHRGPRRRGAFGRRVGGPGSGRDAARFEEPHHLTGPGTIRMRPYLAIILDSFREALHSRVLWLLGIVITLALLLLAPLGYEERLTVQLTESSVRDWPQFLKHLRDEPTKEPRGAAAHVVSALDESTRKKLSEFKMPEEGDISAAMKFVRTIGDVREGLNRQLPRRDFYDAKVWADKPLASEEGRVLLQTRHRQAERPGSRAAQPPVARSRVPGTRRGQRRRCRCRFVTPSGTRSVRSRSAAINSPRGSRRRSR